MFANVGRLRAAAVGALALAALGGLSLLGCGSSSSTDPSGTTGNLTVGITAPTGVTPSVTVTGPSGYKQNLTATQTLSGLDVGSYVVTAGPVEVADPIVGTVYTGTVTRDSVLVRAGATPVDSVYYGSEPGSGMLWVANSNAPGVVAYTAAQLSASTGTAPATALATGVLQFGVAFDASGNLWIASSGNNAVFEFTANQLATSGSPAPAVTLSTRSPLGLAFDASGNLWVTSYDNSTVVEFTGNQLATSASTPAVTLLSTGSSLAGPVGLAFDVSGNLWVANSFDSTVVEFTPSQLTTSGFPTPAVTLSATGSSLSQPAGLAFDASGNLWVANNFNSTIVKFTPGQLATSGSPTPAVALSATGSSLHPWGLAFDETGNLWVTNFTSSISTVVEFVASQLVTSGPATPNLTVSGGALNAPAGLAFNPPPRKLPVR